MLDLKNILNKPKEVSSALLSRGYKLDLELDFAEKAFLLLPFRHTKDIYNVFYCIQKMNFYKERELMDKKKIIIFNKFMNASIKDIKYIFIKKNLLCNNNG